MLTIDGVRPNDDEAAGDGPLPVAVASRRRFLTLVGAAGGVGALSTFLAACGGGGGEETSASNEQRPDRDLEILQFALTLEYLERDLYDQVRKSGQISDPQVARLVQSVYENEKEHAQALEAVVRQFAQEPVEPPRTDFASVIEAGQERIIAVSAEIENLGASAYLGQAGAISDEALLAAALSIHTVEARHAAAFNMLAGNGLAGSGNLKGAIPDGAFAEPRDRSQVLELAAPFIPGYAGDGGLPTAGSAP